MSDSWTRTVIEQAIEKAVNERENAAFQRGVERGKFEQSAESRAERDQLRAELAAAKEQADREGFNLADAKGEIAVLSRKLEDCQATGRALAAENARLRAALELAPMYIDMVLADKKDWLDLENKLAITSDAEQVRSALAATPAQSLAAHDAAVKVAVLDQIKSRLYALASKEVDQPYGYDMNPRQWAATCLECAAEDVTAMQEDIKAEAERIKMEAQRG